MTPPYWCMYLICPFYFFVQRLNSADKHLNGLATKQKHTKKEMFNSYWLFILYMSAYSGSGQVSYSTL